MFCLGLKRNRDVKMNMMFFVRVLYCFVLGNILGISGFVGKCFNFKRRIVKTLGIVEGERRRVFNWSD